MSLSPAAQELDEDLRLLFDGRTIGNGPASERVFGADEGVPRSVEESRDRYRKPIVEAFAASGAETLAEFPARVKTFANAYFHPDHTECQAEHLRLVHVCDTLKAERDQARVDAAALHDRRAKVIHERDMAKAEADRYHAELTALRESEHNARMDATTAHQDCARLRMAAQDSELETNRLKRENAALKDAKGRLTAERNRYKVLAEQQSATVEAGAATIRQAHADMANLKAELDGTQQQLRAVIGIREKQAAELTLVHEKVADLGKKLTLARDELGALYATERRLRESVKWAMKCIEDLLLKGDT